MWERMQKLTPPTYHVNAFDEPDIPVITNEEPGIVRSLHWPFYPNAYTPRNPRTNIPYTTGNARDDKIFKSRMYGDAAKNRRCLVMIDGFFDHHKIPGDPQKVVYPHYVYLKDHEPFLIAGLWQTFEHKQDDIVRDTVTLVTTRANKEMAWIHNEPAYSAESRMVFVVPKGKEDIWLHGSVEEAKSIIEPLPDDVLQYHSCEPIKPNKRLKREYLGNVPEIQNHRVYEKLEESKGNMPEQGSLF